MSAAFAVYGTALVFRPLGALVFGRLGDTRGRRTVLITVIFLMTVATAGVGFLPGYATIGLLAPILLVLLRAAQGLAAGGELGAAAVFMLETCPELATRSGGVVAGATMAVGIGAGMGVAGVLSYLLGEDGRWSGWWRIAFLLALPLGLIGLYLRRRVAETQQFVVLQTTSQVLDHPARELWKRHKVALLRGSASLPPGHLPSTPSSSSCRTISIARHGAESEPDPAREPRRRWPPPPSPLWRSGGCLIGSVDDQLPSVPALRWWYWPCPPHSLLPEDRYSVWCWPRS